ncbi:unnamed protein product [Gadus morhua 'NCC']
MGILAWGGESEMDPTSPLNPASPPEQPNLTPSTPPSIPYPPSLVPPQILYPLQTPLPPAGCLVSLTCVRGIEAGPAGFRGSEWGCLAAAAAPACCQITDPSWRLELVLRCPPELQIPWVETHGGGS